MEIAENEQINNDDDFSQNYINEIKKKVNIMKNSKYRTTFFAIIACFVKNNFVPLSKDVLKSKLIKDYRVSPRSFVNSHINAIIGSESDFRKSILSYIRNYKYFNDGPEEGQISLNLEFACYYLRSVFKKYVNNSRNVSTPIKLYNKFNIKKELIESDNSDEEEKKVKFTQKEKNINYNRNNYKKSHYKIKQEKCDDTNNGNNSIISLSDTSISKSMDKENNEKMKQIPNIFLSKLASESKISSLDIYSLYHIQYLLNEYRLKKENKENYSKSRDKFEKINNSVTNLANNKDSYKKALSRLNNLQKQIYDTWKLMKNQLHIIDSSICTKSYRYDIYVRLRNVIFEAEGIYKDYLHKIKSALNELNYIEKKTKEEIRTIQDALTSIKNDINSDYDFNVLCKIIKEKLYMKDIFQPIDNNSNQIDEYDFDLIDNVGIIVEKFRFENKEILGNMKYLDKYIGNISIY